MSVDGKEALSFLSTDIEGSTRLLLRLGDEYVDVLAVHDRLVQRIVSDLGGEVISTEGDSFFVVFEEAISALEAAVSCQRAFASYRWPGEVAVRVRMGLHTGSATKGTTGYSGFDIHRTARVGSIAHGGQVLITAPMRQATMEQLPAAIRLRDLGFHHLKDLPDPEHLFQVDVGADDQILDRAGHDYLLGSCLGHDAGSQMDSNPENPPRSDAQHNRHDGRISVTRT